jgi:carbonic anhydrase
MSNNIFEWSYQNKELWKYHYPLWAHHETSPINIFPSHVHNQQIFTKYKFTKTSTKAYADNGLIKFEYQDYNNNDNNYFILNKNKYHIKNFHFHSHAEHSINGKFYDTEMHMVGYDNQKSILAVGVLFKICKTNEIRGPSGKTNEIRGPSGKTSNPFIKEFIEHIPKINNGETVLVNIDLNILFDSLDIDSFFHMNGSLTTPPFEPGVKWILYKNPIHISKEDYDILIAVYNNNFRKADECGAYRQYDRENPLAVKYNNDSY